MCLHRDATPYMPGQQWSKDALRHLVCEHDNWKLLREDDGAFTRSYANLTALGNYRLTATLEEYAGALATGNHRPSVGQ